MKLKRILYLAYYLRKLDRKKLAKFLRYASDSTGRPKLGLRMSAVKSVFSHNVSILDYFFFRFFEKDPEECRRWAGTGTMYEYQRRMNPPGPRALLENKFLFNSRFAPYYKREFADLKTIREGGDPVSRLLSHPSGKLVLKNATGQAGKEVKVMEIKGLDAAGLAKEMQKGGYDLVEEYIIQHPDLMALSPSGLNTVRIITQEKDGSIRYLGARLRISINSAVDNLAAGNAAAPVDMETGRVTGPGVFSDITRSDLLTHPVTGVEITGFQVPFWNEVMTLARDAAGMIPENRSIGWDIAVTPEGPVLVEGNHNWCKLLWQLPVKKGLLDELSPYMPVRRGQ